jgi:hypothetical protein
MKITSFTKFNEFLICENYKQGSNLWDNYLIIGNNEIEKLEKLIKKTIIKLLYGIIIF